jgi:hypothetical protein
MVTVEFNFLPFSYQLCFKTNNADAYRKIKERVKIAFPKGRNRILQNTFSMSANGLAWSANDNVKRIQLFFGINHQGSSHQFDDGTEFTVPRRTEDDVKTFVAKVFNAIIDTDAKPEPVTQVTPAPVSEEWTTSYEVDALDDSAQRTFLKEENIPAEKACDAVGVFLKQAYDIKKGFRKDFDKKMGSASPNWPEEKREFYKDLIGRGQITSQSNKIIERPKRRMNIGHEQVAFGTQSTSATASFVPSTTTGLFSPPQVPPAGRQPTGANFVPSETTDFSSSTTNTMRR